MPELEIDGITLRFGGMAVLNAVSLSVRAGELLALIGPNGAGKTSIFNCISGIYKPEGAIRLRGEDICGRSPHRIAACGVGRTFQHAELFEEMSVLENVMAGLHTRLKPDALANMVRWPSSQQREQEYRAVAEEVLDFLELRHLAHQTVGNLPFGVHKLEIGRASCRERV